MLLDVIEGGFCVCRLSQSVPGCPVDAYVLLNIIETSTLRLVECRYEHNPENRLKVGLLEPLWENRSIGWIILIAN